MIAERIRDKVAAAKRRGKYTGGPPVLGYDVDREAKKLVVNEEETELVRHIFKRFCQLGSTTTLARELNDDGHRTKSWTTKKGKTRVGVRWHKGHLYRLLNNRTYLGEVEHRGKVYAGEHDAIVTRKLWDRAHAILEKNCAARSNGTRAKTPALLKGIIRCSPCGASMGPTFTKKNGKIYRYYLCVHASKNGYRECPVRSVAAGEIEEAVVGQLRAVFRTPEIIARTYREAKARESGEVERLRGEGAEIEEQLAALKIQLSTLVEAGGEDGGTIAEQLRRTGAEMDALNSRLETVTHQLRALESKTLTEREVVDALDQLDPVWDELFPGEQARIVQLLVERVDVRPDGLELRLRSDGLRSLVCEIDGRGEEARAG